MSHPIQHFCPLYAELATDPRIDLTVLFGVGTGATDFHDPGFGAVIDTGVRRELDRFDHLFLSDSPDLSTEAGLRRRAVWEVLDDLDPDVVVVYGTHQATPRWTWLWSRRRRRPVAYISDSEDRGDYRRPGLTRLLSAMVLAVTTVVLSVGDANRAYYRHRGVPSARIRNVPFPIDRNLYAQASLHREQLRREARSLLGVTDEVLLLSCGKLIARKRHIDLIESIGQMDGPRPVVALIGSGEQQSVLSARATELGVDVRFPGFVPPPDLPALYLAGDIYAHPSASDPHPLAISEAIACGLPVVVSDHVGSWGPTDDVQPGTNGTVVPLGDTGALAAAIGRLRDDGHLRQSYGDASMRISQQRQDLAFRGFADAIVELAT